MTEREVEGEEQTSALGRFILWLPMPPTIRVGGFVWAHLGVAAGAMLVRDGVFPTEYIVWGALVVAGLAQIARQL